MHVLKVFRLRLLYIHVINNDWKLLGFFYLCYISTEERTGNTARFLVIVTEQYTPLTLGRCSIGFLRHQVNLGRVRLGIPV